MEEREWSIQEVAEADLYARRIDDVAATLRVMLDEVPARHSGRWLQIGRTHMQEGLMAIRRSVSDHPDGF